MHCPFAHSPFAAEPGATPRPQVEILRRLRAEPGNTELRDALLITINGVAAGMRNAG